MSCMARTSALPMRPHAAEGLRLRRPTGVPVPFSALLMCLTAVMAASPPARPAAGAGAAVGVLFVGLVKDSERDLPTRFAELQDYACLLGVSASVLFLESNSKDASRRLLEEFSSESATLECRPAASGGPGGRKAFRLVQILGETPTAPTGGDGVANTHEDDRILRIAGLRDQLRDAARPIAAKLGARAVVVLDTDLKTLPSAAALARAIARLSDSSGGGGGTAPTVQCANGQQGHKHRSTYYDLFATVLADGTMPMQRIVSSDTPRDEGDRIKKELTASIKKHAPPGELFPVLSCFGGLAVYDAFSYFVESCRYSGGRRGDRYAITSHPRNGAPHKGFACEHVHFHTCLRESIDRVRAGGYSAGVDPGMVTWWQWRKA